ncbi:MAG: hypothetical protein ACPGU0_04645, partial [Marinirhabdus sp.]
MEILLFTVLASVAGVAVYYLSKIGMPSVCPLPQRVPTMGRPPIYLAFGDGGEIIESSEVNPANSNGTENPQHRKPHMCATPANNGMEDGITAAYFAKKISEKVKTDKAGSPYLYPFRNENTITDVNKDKIATIIIKNSKTKLEAKNEYLTQPDVVSALKNKTYAAGSSLEIPTKKLEDCVKFEKIDSAPLESDVYVFASTVNLDEKEITITIHEKEALLVGANAPLPVLKRDKNGGEDQKTEDLQEITELKDTVDEGFVAIPIRLRPKSDKDLKEWRDKLAGKKDKDSKEITPGKKGVKELLWLKASAQGDEEKHEGEFLNADEKLYFELTDCIILRWGKKFTCAERRKVVAIAKKLELSENKIEVITKLDNTIKIVNLPNSLIQALINILQNSIEA